VRLPIFFVVITVTSPGNLVACPCFLAKGNIKPSIEGLNLLST